MENPSDIQNHEYKIDAEGERIAEVSKKWFQVRDTFVLISMMTGASSL